MISPLIPSGPGFACKQFERLETSYERLNPAVDFLRFSAVFTAGPTHSFRTLLLIRRGLPRVANSHCSTFARVQYPKPEKKSSLVAADIRDLVQFCPIKTDRFILEAPGLHDP